MSNDVLFEKAAWKAYNDGNVICIRENILGPEAHKIMVGQIRKAIHVAVFEERELREKLSWARAGQLTRDMVGPAPGPFEFKVIVEFGRKLNHALIPVDVVLHSGNRFQSIGTVVCKMLDDMVSPTFEGPKT